MGISVLTQIPSDQNPIWSCEIGNKVYEYPSGSIQDNLPQCVVDIIDNINSLKPKESASSRFESTVVSFRIDDYGKINADMTPNEVVEKMINGVVVGFVENYEMKSPLGVCSIDMESQTPCFGFRGVAEDGSNEYLIKAGNNGWEFGY